MKRVFVRGNAVACSNYDAALRASGMEPVFSMDLALADCCDGLLLTGGYDVDPAYYGQANTASVNIDPIRDKEEIALVRRFMELERPIFGICRGHQVLNVALGGDMIQHIPNHAEVAPGVDHSHCVFAEHDFMKNIYADQFVVNSAHHQIVNRLGEGLSVTCRSEENYIEGIIHENGMVFGVQFHPERMCYAKRRSDTIDGAVLFDVFREMLNR